MKQKIIVDESSVDFERRVNEALASGWSVKPETVRMVASGFGEYSVARLFAVVVEKAD